MGSSTTLKTQVKHLLRNPVFSPTAKQLQSSLNVIERTSGRLVVSRGGRVFMIVPIAPNRCRGVVADEGRCRAG